MKAPYLRIYSLICLFLLINFLGEAQHSKEALKKNISIQQSEIRLDSLMRVFSRQSGFEFSFNSKKILPTRKVTVNKRTQTVSEWLNKLQTTFGIEHKFVGNHIILVDNPKQGISKSKTIAVKKSAPKPLKADHVALTKNTAPKNQNNKKEKEAASIAKNETVTTHTDSSILQAKVDASPQQDRSSVTQSPIIETLKDSTKTKSTTSVPVITKSDDENEVVEEFRAVAGYSKHGSGDMDGVVFGAEYSRNTDKRFFLTYQLRGGFNSSVDKVTFINTITGTVTDVSIRFNTGGVQIGMLGSINIIRSSKHKFQVGIGPFARYQSTSNDGYGMYYPTTTGVPNVLYEFYNPNPQHTVSFGGIFQLQYQFYVSRKMFVGIMGGFQTDTNGDAIPQAGLIFGRHLQAYK